MHGVTEDSDNTIRHRVDITNSVHLSDRRLVQNSDSKLQSHCLVMGVLHKPCRVWTKWAGNVGNQNKTKPQNQTKAGRLNGILMNARSRTQLHP